MKGKTLCPGCYSPVDEDAQSCPSCSARFNAPIFRAPPTVQMKVRDAVLWRWVVPGVFVIFGCTGFLSLLVFMVLYDSGHTDSFVRFMEYLPWALVSGFFIGGILIARVSKGSTIREPAISGALSALCLVLLLGISTPSQLILWVITGIPAAILTAVGAYAGELMQKNSLARKRRRLGG